MGAAVHTYTGLGRGLCQASLSGQGQGQEGCWVQSVDINYLFSWETETVCVSVLMKKSKTIVSNLHFYHPIYVLETV